MKVRSTESENVRQGSILADGSVVSLLVMLLATLLMFGDVLLLPGRKVLSSGGTDLAAQFVHFRAFAAHELRQGNLPLWNPHLFAGMPYLGGFQSALLYPLNIVYLLLPLARAINVGIALHVWLAGVFMYAWARERGLHPMASLLGGLLFMFGGTHFPHIYAGHLPNLCTLVWTPLLFMTVDRLARDGCATIRALLLGVFAVGMQILGGHPQYVFYSAVAAALYTIVRAVQTKRVLHLFGGLTAVYIAAAVLTAAQLLTGFDAAGESVRNSGLPYRVAAMFSLPPENLITLLVPRFFGDMVHVPYWGRCYMWEMSLFVGVSGLFLAALGARVAEPGLRRAALIMVAVLTVLALGSHTPLFPVLYRVAPGFDKFRGCSKFTLQASLFLILLASSGFDQLLRGLPPGRRTVFLPLGSALTAVVLAGFILWSGQAAGVRGFWGGILRAVAATRESYLPGQSYHTPAFIAQSARFAAAGLGIFAATAAVFAALLGLMRRSTRFGCLLLALAAVEVMAFAKAYRPVFQLGTALPSSVAHFAEQHTGDDRVLDLANPNSVMSFGLDNLWGYDPGVLRRYAEFMAFTQGVHPDQASQYLEFKQFHRLYFMLRGGYILEGGSGAAAVQKIEGAMPRVLLVHDFLVRTERDAIFAELAKKEFDPRQTVVLEESPEPPPVRGEADDRVSVTESSTDHLLIAAELSAPAVLLITDGYSKGWRAVSLPGSVQQKYRLLPANYVLRAIPLQAGRHRIRVEYSPLAFRVGKWISLAGLLLFVAAFFFRRSANAES